MVFTQVAISSEHYLVNEVVQSLVPSDVFVDLGAFIGEFPIALVNNNIPFEKCYCFEISRQNCDLLREYTQNAGINNVEIIQKAAFEENGTIRINECDANSAITKDLSGTAVDAVKLDTVFEKNRSII